MNEDHKRESGGHKRESEGHKRGSEGHRRGSGDCKRESEGHKRESDGHRRGSEGHKRESGGHKRESEGRKRDSEDRKREIRTQGKFSEMSMMKSRDKRQKSSPVLKEHLEKKTHKKYESGGASNSYIDDDTSTVIYRENSDYRFDQLEDQKKSIEIIEPGKHTLSNTENGESFIFYEPELLTLPEAEDYYERLYTSISWYSKNIVINGEEFPQPRLIAWFGPYPYSYSGATLEPQEMPDCVLQIKSKVEEFLTENGFKATFNSVLLNLYRDGKDSVAWHSDDESTMGISPTIASVSLGEMRKFEMRRKKKYPDDNPSKKQAEYFIHLEHGSLIIMDGCMQEDWQHRVPKEYHDKGPRINLTFRTVYPIEEVSHREPIREFKKEQVNEWTSNGAPRSKNNFDDDDFPPLKSEDFPPLKREDDFPPLKSEDNFPPLQSEDFPPLKSEDSFSPLKSEDNFLSLKSEDYFSQLNNNDLSHPPSDVRVASVDSSSNSSMRNDELNVSYEHWDDETLSNEKCKAKSDLSTDHTFDSNFEINEVKKNEKFIDDNENSFEVNSVEGQVGDSVSSSDITKEFIDVREPPKKWLNVAAKVFVPKNFEIELSYQGPDYSKFSLSDLIHYEVELMSAETVQEFSKYLKIRVCQNLNNFSRFIRDELEFLCLLTDGTQTEKNQKLISMRIINFVSNDFQRQRTFSDRHPRTHSFGKPNNADRGRYRPNQGRANAHRY